jgi:hypothetical protein
MDGMPPMTKIVAGYLLDDFQQEIERVAITCSIGSRVIWTLDIPRPQAGVVQPFETPRSQPPAPAVRSARNPKEDEQRSDSESS